MDKYEIVSRDLTFDFSGAARPWLNQDAYLTHMFNASSLFLPYVEGFVNYAVHNAMQSVEDKKLLADCRQFIQQETLHAREHVKYNGVLGFYGFSCSDIVQSIKNKLKRIRMKWTILSVLGAAAGFECFTAIISQVVLEEGLLNQADENLKRFWRWHMTEELEHKTVLMDLYHYLGGGYFRRISILTLVLIGYCCYGMRIYFNLLRVGHLSRWKGLACICGKKSFFRKSLIQAFRCYHYRYHPRLMRTDHLRAEDFSA
ncbi:metal-dependent hydrolase [Aquicella siphonis]|nr:metal-dependent hydrolase [Aquicella siphonis]